MNDEEVLGEQRRLILLRKFKSDPRLLKMLKEKIKWGPDRHAAYKTDLNEHIGRSIERYLMRKDDGKADTDTRGVKVAKSTRRLVDTNTHARYAKDRLADALAALATIGHTPL